MHTNLKLELPNYDDAKLIKPCPNLSRISKIVTFSLSIP